MQDKDIYPMIISYNATISACEMHGEWERALELLEAISISKVARWWVHLASHKLEKDSSKTRRASVVRSAAVHVSVGNAPGQT